MKKIYFILTLTLFSDSIFCSQRSNLPIICVRKIVDLIDHLSTNDDTDLIHLKELLSIKKNQIDRYNDIISTDYVEDVSRYNTFLSDQSFLFSLKIEDEDLVLLRKISDAILKTKNIDPVSYMKQNGRLEGTKFFAKNFCIPKSLESWSLAAAGAIATYYTLSSCLKLSGINMPAIEIKNLDGSILSISKDLILSLGGASAAVIATTRRNWSNYCSNSQINRDGLVHRIESISHENNNIAICFNIYDLLNDLEELRLNFTAEIRYLELEQIASLTEFEDNITELRI